MIWLRARGDKLELFENKWYGAVMKVNSGSALIAGRKVLASNNNSWGKVHESGVRRADGVIVVHKESSAPKAAEKATKT